MTLYLTNWASRKQHGPGRKLCCMIRPREWEKGDGRIPELSPLPMDFDAWWRGDVSLGEYMEEFLKSVERFDLSPGVLEFIDAQGVSHVVEDGDTLLCACAKPDNPNREHSCHIEAFAPLLKKAGWGVILYGKELGDGQEN